MIRPASFASNPQTLASNRFQAAHDGNASDVQRAAQLEFDALVNALGKAGVDVHVYEDTPTPVKPDAVFPNNWFSTHRNGIVVLYPMLAPNRRFERRTDIIEALHARDGFHIHATIDLTHRELENKYLEGTGSLVLDRPRRTAYACLSPRTHGEALAEFGRALEYETVAFDAADRHGRPIYHTNVMLALGSSFAAVCAGAIAPHDRRRVLDRLAATGREILDLTFEQLHAFAGNALELEARDGRRVIALSDTARAALEPVTARRLAAHGELVSADISAIEKHGGGSVRCMLCEVHLPRDRGEA